MGGRSLKPVILNGLKVNKKPPSYEDGFKDYNKYIQILKQ